ncbi:hypothetical protein GCM10023100_12630 [Actinocorallia cavernae]|uniref:Uncharacterized protein n=2 Tax=Actinomycetes TaxID=1760 RepID=A0ABP8SC21_9ACTN
MTASVGFSILGSGTSSTRTSRLPCQVTAFMRSRSLGRVGPLVAWVRLAVAAGYPRVRAPNPLAGTARVPGGCWTGAQRV